MAQKTGTATKAKSTQPKKAAPRKSVSKKSPARPVATAVVQAEPKKSRKGLVAIIILVVLVILGLVGAGVYFCWYNNPEQVAYDAVTQLARADNIALEGELLLSARSTDSPVQRVTVDFDSASSSLPYATSAKVTVFFRTDSTDDTKIDKFSISLQNVIMKDGVIYLQISGLMDSVENLIPDEDMRSELEIYLGTLEIIDNEWWKIDLAEVLNELDLPSSQVKALTGIYDCALEAANRDSRNEVVELYKQNRFVNIERTKYLEPESDSAHTVIEPGHQAYRLSLDKAKMADFANRTVESETTSEFITCYNKVARKYGGNTIDLSDITEISADDVEVSEDIYVGLEISNFGHRIRSIHFQSEDTNADYEFDGAVLIKYVDAVVEAPSEYRPISDLIMEIVELIAPLIEEA